MSDSSSSSAPPSVDVTAPDGRPIVLRPVIPLERLRDLSPASLAAVVCLCLIFGATSLTRLNHTDLWGHLSLGRWIVRHGQFPSVDPFQSFTAGEPFLNVPWLSQVLGYGMYQLGGLEGLVLAHAALATLTAAALLWAVRARGVTLGWAVTAVAASSLLALPVTGTLRPQWFGILGFALTLAALARLPRHRDPLLWLPLVFALWVNLHGSFWLGLAVLSGMVVAAAWEVRGWRWSNLRRRRHLRRMLWALVLATVGTCLNPYGPRLLLLVGPLGENANLVDLFEWRPLTLGSLSGGLCVVSFLLTVVLLRWSRRRIRAGEILLTLLFLVACLSASRMLAWWALLWPWIVAPHAAGLWHRGQRGQAGAPAALGTPRRLLAAAVMVVLTLWWAPPTQALLTGQSRPDEAILLPGMPKAVADMAQELGLRGRCFAPWDWADYLIWRSDGGLEPLVYSRVHLGEASLWQDFLSLREGRDNWLAAAQKHQLNYLFLPPKGCVNLRHALGALPSGTQSYRCSQGEIVVLPANTP